MNFEEKEKQIPRQFHMKQKTLDNAQFDRMYANIEKREITARVILK